MQGEPGEVTRLLNLASGGSREAVQSLFPIVYGELRRLAQGYVAGERQGHTLSATALVHEVYIKLVGQDSIGFRDRAQFFGVASRAMRRILVDHARTRRRLKRGGSVVGEPLDDALAAVEQRAIDLVELDEVLDELARLDETKARLIELRFFGGLEMAAVAELMGMPLRSVERQWTMARAFLRSRIAGGATST